jgi:hypothetical protein
MNRLLHFSTLKSHRAHEGAPRQIGDLTVAWGLLFTNGVFMPGWMVELLRRKHAADRNPGTDEDPSPEQLRLQQWFTPPARVS